MERRTKILFGCFSFVLAAVGIGFGVIAGIVWWNHEPPPEFREGVEVYTGMLIWVPQELLSLSAPIEIGYAETGEGCHTASGALLLRSGKVQRVLTTIDTPVCDDRSADDVLASMPLERLTTAVSPETSALWLEKDDSQGSAGDGDAFQSRVYSRAAENALRIDEGHPWSQVLLINCSRDRMRYSLRVLLPRLVYAGSQFEQIAAVDFHEGTCMDPTHWPKLDALIDLIWALEGYRPS